MRNYILRSVYFVFAISAPLCRKCDAILSVDMFCKPNHSCQQKVLDYVLFLANYVGLSNIHFEKAKIFKISPWA